MISKKGYCILSEIQFQEKNINGVIVPETHTKIPNCQRISSFGIDTECSDFSIGDAVIFDSDVKNSVRISFLGEWLFFRKVSSILAVVEGGDQDVQQSDEQLMMSEVDKKFDGISAIGSKIIIDRACKKDYYLSGKIAVPYTKREIGRCHYGTVIAISDSTSEQTGIKRGMKVFYDYNASFGHENDFDVVDEESVFAMLTQSEFLGLEMR